ncbi:MAG: nitronate monooxygenase [Solirubrobacterales bacterium]|nr:nitronate monooxygenase [Solirubrobacterales bacterium]
MNIETPVAAPRPESQMHTAFTDLVGCELPIQQAAFGSLSPELVAAVSGAGGLGMIGAPTASAEALSAAFDQVRTRTNAPVGVNFVAPFFDLNRDAEALNVAIERAALVEFFYGHPDVDLVNRIHAGGSLASWQVGSVNGAVAAAGCGCDLVVVQGHEAGGHLAGTHALLPMLCEVLDLVDIPVLAAGGITTPRALAAALAAGAAGARVGTALVVAEEADFHPVYKQAVIAASSADAVYSKVFDAFWPNAPHRVLRSAIAAVHSLDTPTVGAMELGGHRVEVPRAAGAAPVAGATGHIEAMALFAGQGVGSVTQLLPAATILRELASGAQTLLHAAS